VNDEDCLRAIAGGGKRAQDGIATLYDRYARRFQAYLMRRRCSREDAEDMVQDVFVKIASMLKNSESNIESGRAYLYRAVHNRLIDHIRANRRTMDEARSATGSEPREALDVELVPGELGFDEDNTGFLLCFQGALNNFYAENSEAGTAIDLAAIEGFSGQELAEVLGRSFGATREFLSQCRKKFQSLLMELCYDYIPESSRDS
jgi:RNA polymerase sigma factor (sigma-70 family)